MRKHTTENQRTVSFIYSRFTCLKIAVLLTGSFFFFWPTQAEKMVFSQLKALASAEVRKKNITILRHANRKIV